MKTKAKKPKLLIQAKIGDAWFNVYAEYVELGASYAMSKSPTGNNRMYISVAGDAPYEQALDQLMHESMEAALSIRGGKFERAHDNFKMTAYCHFMFDHETFQRSITEVVAFMTKVEPKLRKEWERTHPNGKDYWEWEL